MKLKVEKEEAEAYIQLLACSLTVINRLEFLESKRRIKQKTKFVGKNFINELELIQKEFWASDNMLDEYDKLMEYVNTNWAIIMKGLEWEELEPVSDETELTPVTSIAPTLVKPKKSRAKSK